MGPSLAVLLTTFALSKLVGPAVAQPPDPWNRTTEAWGRESAAADDLKAAWQTEPRPAIEQVLDSWVPSLLEEFPTPGAAVLVLRDGRVIYREFFGDADRARRLTITEGTLFNVSSISKTLTAFGVMRLVEEGEIGLDEPIQRYVRRWELPPSDFDASAVTVRRVLSHTAGLTPGSGAGYGPGDDLPTLEDVLSGTAPDRQPLLITADPGTGVRYSNGAYGLLQLLIEEVTGRPFAVYMDSAVLRPLAMTSSAFGDPTAPEIAARIATPHDWLLDPVHPPRLANLAAGGLFTTLDDMGRLAAAEFYASNSNRTAVVSLDAVRLMHAPVAPSKRFGLGHVIHDGGPVRVVGHTGLGSGWNASFQVVPATRDAIVVLTNGDNGYYVHHTIVFAWSAWTVGRPLGGSVAAQKRLNRLAGVLEFAAEAAAIAVSVTQELAPLVERASSELEADQPGAARRSLEELLELADRFASEGRLSQDALAGIRQHVGGGIGWLQVLEATQSVRP
ncbi:MAG: beta-lactamase family protein [Gemmatimonadetes bacterium]|uniref:Beta-lactamase family protein n=1 Tax=Candidatus Kutchimonas denitrificans TaxID=3056748 RepID=A0AAE4Z678_9BACT|nr:beta-lactamase family protein [Gemmatimonadota bacterium]NIR74089.1 beta-lactamase family protein [Candidatus Kutchimonas denitrificans]NIS01651.1 beta-lactamase family protein [Gemmatimonadota bacterium]NIT67389.1 beta-lactamase family protein [Gemmatimonadota bacterium]NIU52752.1 serine hydrolase [Gemmatimonadota bacterium]